MIVTRRMAERRCPSCDHAIDAVTGRGGPPRAGDLTLCWFCADLLVFTSADGDVRAATDAEYSELSAELKSQIASMRAERSRIFAAQRGAS